MSSDPDVLVYRFPRYQNQIKYGAKLIVREGQGTILLHAFGTGGADGEGNCRYPQLWKPVTTWLEMREALASYATRAAEKMRRYKVAADNLFVFMHTNTFNNNPFYSNGASARFPATTNDTGEVVALAVRLGERLFRDGYRYAKCGVMITLCKLLDLVL